MKLDITTNKIVKDYLQSNVDMNESIVKCAEKESLNLEQVKRLVEECNKKCYLDKLASTGEQVFDIADIGKIKTLIKSDTKLEKVASFNTGSYSNMNAYGTDGFEKVASAEPSKEEIEAAIERCKDNKGASLTKIASLVKTMSYQMPELEKVAFESIPELTVGTKLEKLGSELNDEMINCNKWETIKHNLMEKRAGIASGVLSAGAKATGWAVKAPFKRVVTPVFAVGTFKTGATKAADKVETEFVSNLPKTASIGSSIASALKGALGNELYSATSKVIENAAPYALALGAVGVGASVARGMGGFTTAMMDKKHLNDAFATMYSHNEDIREIPNARAYFDLVARHAPSLALDPLVAPQLIRQFDTFGGVDVNTVGKLREIQNTGPKQENKQFDFVGTASGLLGKKDKDK